MSPQRPGEPQRLGGAAIARGYGGAANERHRKLPSGRFQARDRVDGVDCTGPVMFATGEATGYGLYVCAGHRPGHQLAILAQPVDDLVGERVLELLTTPACREALLSQTGRIAGIDLRRALAELGSAQTRLQTLDDDHYIRGALGVAATGRSGLGLSEKVERLHGRVDAANKPAAADLRSRIDARTDETFAVSVCPRSIERRGITAEQVRAIGARPRHLAEILVEVAEGRSVLVHVG